MPKQLKTPRPDARYYSQGADIEGLMGYGLKRAYMVAHEAFRKALGKEGLGPRVFSALSIVVQHPHITQSDLARTLGIERSGLVAIVDELEGQKYLIRKPVPGDRRVQALEPTDEGIAAYRDALKKVQTQEAELLSKLSDSERATLLTLLQKVRDADG